MLGADTSAALLKQAAAQRPADPLNEMNRGQALNVPRENRPRKLHESRDRRNKNDTHQIKNTYRQLDPNFRKNSTSETIMKATECSIVCQNANFTYALLQNKPVMVSK